MPLVTSLLMLFVTGCSALPAIGIGATATPEPPLFQYDRAIATAEAGGTSQERADAYLARGDAHAARDAYDAALSDYGRAIEFEPANARIYNNRALVYEALGQYEAALDDYFTATELDPAYTRAFRNRTALLARTGAEPRLLAEDYGRLARLDPGSAPEYLYRQGVILRALRDDAGARAAYDAALAADPQQVDALYERALLNYAEGRLDAALADLDRAIRLSPRAANAYYARGLARQSAGDRAGALNDLNEALRLAPGNVEALLARAALRHLNGDRAGAIADLDRLSQLAVPDDLQSAAAVLRREIGD